MSDNVYFLLGWEMRPVAHSFNDEFFEPKRKPEKML